MVVDFDVPSAFPLDLADRHGEGIGLLLSVKTNMMVMDQYVGDFNVMRGLASVNIYSAN